MQRYREAENVLRRAIAIAEKAGYEATTSLADSLGCLGRVYTEQHNFAEAESCLKKRSLELTRLRQGDCCRNYGMVLDFLGQFSTPCHWFGEAETTYLFRLLTFTTRSTARFWPYKL